MDPSEEQLEELGQEIVNWKFARAEDFWSLMRHMKRLMEPAGRVWEDENGMVRLATGGCSDNEDLMRDLEQNRIFWMLFWASSHRGGLTILRPPIVKELGQPAECRL
jgi:hypothetical protein